MSVHRIHPIPSGDYAWHARAACAGMPAELFVGPEIEDVSARSHRESMALRICQGCQVRRACLDHAVRTPERHGVWGGTTPEQRRQRLVRLPTDGPFPGPAAGVPPRLRPVPPAP